MTVPGRREAARLLCSLDPPAWFLRHACAVADAAAWLARASHERGHALDRRLVEAAALLHDIDKLLPENDAAARLPHGLGTAAWLAARGFGELGPVVAAHPLARLADGPRKRTKRGRAGARGAGGTLGARPRAAIGTTADLGPGGDEVGGPGAWSLEARIVAYADKRAGQRLEPMDARFASWARRYPAGPGAAWDDALAERIRLVADVLEADVCAAAGVRPAAVRRLRWSRRALAAVASETRPGIAAGPRTAGRTRRPSAATPPMPGHAA